jgi:hypothetical protein
MVIGCAEQEIQERMLALTKQNEETMAVESGIESCLTEDVKQYLERTPTAMNFSRVIIQ